MAYPDSPLDDLPGSPRKVTVRERLRRWKDDRADVLDKLRPGASPEAQRFEYGDALVIEYREIELSPAETQAALGFVAPDRTADSDARATSYVPGPDRDGVQARLRGDAE